MFFGPNGSTSSGGTVGRCAAGWGFANIITYLKHRITNATSESINAKIQWVRYTAWTSPQEPLNSQEAPFMKDR
jgi:hypothetical protein